MQTTIRSLTTISCTVLLLAAGAYGAPSRLAPYTDNPLVQSLAQQRLFVEAATQIDTASNDHDTLSFFGILGTYISDSWTAGAYGSVRGSDRRFPNRMSTMYGIGAFSEYNLAPQAAVQPFGGARLGIIDTDGPANPTSLHIAGILGVKVPLTERLILSAAGILNWAEEDILDYTENEDGSFSAENQDFGLEFGLRFAF